MRSGFSVCAKAYRCQALLPKKLWRARVCRRRLATLLSLETSAENSRTSPACKGGVASAGAACSAAALSLDGEAAETVSARRGSAEERAKLVDGGAFDTWSETLKPCIQ